MKRSSKNIVLAVVLSLLGTASFSYAQSLDNISDFKLNSEKETSVNETLATKGERFSDEFNLSLGSQMLSYENTSKIFSSEAKHIETGFEGFNSSIKLDDFEINAEAQKDFASQITLNSSYEDNAIGFGDNSTPVFSLSGKAGRLSFYGKYNQSNLSINSGENKSSDSIQTSMRASTSATNELPIQEDTVRSNPTSVSSDYYFEAVYSFKPNIKGKVAYKKTVMDAFDLKENVEVEGIVDVTNDVSIKASFLNENRPDLDNKSSSEKKVLTEFILKF